MNTNTQTKLMVMRQQQTQWDLTGPNIEIAILNKYTETAKNCLLLNWPNMETIISTTEMH